MLCWQVHDVRALATRLANIRYHHVRLTLSDRLDRNENLRCYFIIHMRVCKCVFVFLFQVYKL